MTSDDMKPDYDTTLARIAGTIAAGLASAPRLSISPEPVNWYADQSVLIAQAIVARCRRQAQAEQRPPTNMPSAVSNSSSSRPNTTNPSST